MGFKLHKPRASELFGSLDFPCCPQGREKEVKTGEDSKSPEIPVTTAAKAVGETASRRELLGYMRPTSYLLNSPVLINSQHRADAAIP